MVSFLLTMKQHKIDFSRPQTYNFTDIYYHRHFIPQTVINSLFQNKRLSFDCETYGVGEDDGLLWWVGKIRLLQLGMDNGIVHIFDIMLLPKESIDRLIKAFYRFLGDRKKQILTHNGKFDYCFLFAMFGVTSVTNIQDTYQASLVCYSGVSYGSLFSNSLKAVAAREIGLKVDKTEQSSDWGARHLTQSQLEYAAKDVRILPRIWASLLKRAKELEIVRAVKIECEVIYAFTRMELTGFPIDIERTKVCLDFHTKLRDEAYAKFQKDFPGLPTSGSNLLKAVNLKYGLQLKGIDASVLEGMEQEAMVGLNDYRSLKKHCDYLQNMLDYNRNGRIYSNFGLIGATSLGRSSSRAAVRGKNHTGFNLQNIPKPFYYKKDPKLAKEFSIRTCLKCTTISDLSAAHSKIAVEASQDVVSTVVENKGGDIHLFTVQSLLEMLGEDVPSLEELARIRKDKEHPMNIRVEKLRELAKNVRYSSFNLGGAARLQATCAEKGLDFTVDMCRDAIKVWRNVHSDIYSYQMRKQREANSFDYEFEDIPDVTFGKVTGITGRVHFLPKFYSDYSKKKEVKAADCMSSLWMLPESEVMKKSMIIIQREFDKHPEWCGELNLLCHD